MKILLINQDWFKHEFEQEGHSCISAGLANHLDVVLPPVIIHINTLLERIGFSPDYIVVHDNSMALIVRGLDEISIPTLFYGVDTHHHVELHSFLYELFDFTFIAQRDYLPYFHERGQFPEWLPLWASRMVVPQKEKEYGATFVGSLDPALNPSRVEFFNRLKEAAPIFFTSGEWWKYFDRSEIVVNQTVKGDLNFRVFEVMISGALLLTERGGNGLLELFRDAEHLVTYEKNNVEEAAAKINYYLSNPDEARRIAKSGREEIVEKHLPIHRARKILEVLSELPKTHRPSRHIASMINFSALSQTMQKKSFDDANILLAHTAAIQALRAALEARESFTDEICCHALRSCIGYDALTRGSTGHDLLDEVSAAQPHLLVPHYVRIRRLLNLGKIVEAKELASAVSNEDHGVVFARAEGLIQNLVGVNRFQR